MNAGGGQTGCRRAGADLELTSTDRDWAGVTEAWAASAAGLTAGQYVRIHETFTSPGKTTATDDFGERWDIAPAGSVKHRTAGGVLWRGGVMVFEDSGAWIDNYALWKGPGLIMDGAAEKSATVYRLLQYVRPAPSAFNQIYVALFDTFPTPTKYIAFEHNEALSATKCVVQLSGSADVVTTFPIASLSSAQRDIAFIQNGLTWRVYVDRSLVATLTSNGTNGDLKPFIYSNRGDLLVDDVLLLVNGGLA